MPGGAGRVADHIPALSEVDPAAFGFAVAGADGEVLGVEDWLTPFSIQSVSKVFSLALALAGGDSLWARVGREPSGNPFNSLVQLENEDGIPRNPFINAGALVVTDRLLTLTGDARGAVLELLRAESGNPSIDFDPDVARSEAAPGRPQRRAGPLHGQLRQPGEPGRAGAGALLLAVLDRDELPRPGRRRRAVPGPARPARRRFPPAGPRRREADQLDHAHVRRVRRGGRVRLPGGPAGQERCGRRDPAVVPGRCTLCVWSPALDRHGNPVAGVDALDRFTTRTGLSVF